MISSCRGVCNESRNHSRTTTSTSVGFWASLPRSFDSINL